MKTVCVSFKAHMGWTNAVAVLVDAPSPTPVYTGRVDLVATDDRDVSEPYHVAGGWHGLNRVTQPRDPAATVRNGRRRQASAAKVQLNAFGQTLEAAQLRWTRAVVLTGRGRLSDDLDRILGSHAHIHVAEGDAIRDATRIALDAMRIERIDQDEKSVLSDAIHSLKCSAADCDSLMKNARPAGAKSWRKEERLLALAAWLNRK